jgi:hypothetical protein
LSSHGDEAQRVGQTASAWCHGGGQTTAFPVVRSGSLTTALAPDLDKRMVADVRGPLPAALAVWGAGSSRPPISRCPRGDLGTAKWEPSHQRPSRWGRGAVCAASLSWSERDAATGQDDWLTSL